MREKIKQHIEEFLQSVAIRDFIVVCDETNNSFSDQNILNVDFAVKPNESNDWIYSHVESTTLTEDFTTPQEDQKGSLVETLPQSLDQIS